MNDLNFTFEPLPWERELDALCPGQTLSAAHFLALLEGEDEDTFEQACQDLQDKGISLDTGDLPRLSGGGETAVRLRYERQLVEAGDLYGALEKSDPLKLYLEELAMIPACGDEAVLAMDAAQGNENARAMLVNLSLSRVVELAQEHVDRGVLLLDLIQEGSLGLWQGILEYTSGDFADHRDWWIRFYMTRLIVSQARSGGVGQKLRQAAEDYRAVDERLLSELGRNPTLDEIAQEMHMTVAEVATVERLLESARLIQRAHKPREEEQEDEKQAQEQAVEDTAYFQTRQRIAELLSGLDEVDAKLLTLRFGLEGAAPMSPEEVGKMLGMTPGEVVSREAAALATLRK